MTIFDFALSYAARGFPIFPLIPRGKNPLISKGNGGNGYFDATTSQEQITKWWQNTPAANIGLATGQISGIAVLDIDPRHGGDKTLVALIKKYGPLPHTLVVSTGGGGWHLYFKHVAGLRNSAGHIGDGLDIRADGGYVVVPPSIHDSGQQYQYICDPGQTFPAIAEMPAWLASLAEQHEQAVKADLPENWRRLVTDGVAEGKRNTAIARLAGHLLGRHVDPYVTLDLVSLWNSARCKPPLPEKEVSATINNIAGREYEKRRRAS